MEAWQITTTVILLYCLLVLAIGYISGKVLKKSLEDFYVLSRKAGTIVTFLATASTYHSAFAFLTSVTSSGRDSPGEAWSSTCSE